MFGTTRYSESLQTLWQEVKSHLEKEKQYLAMDAAEKLIVLLSSIAIAAVCLLLGAMALAFLLIALALLIGQLMGCMAAGFLTMGGLSLVLMAVAYRKRHAWITQPLARLIVTLFIHEGRKEDVDE